MPLTRPRDTSITGINPDEVYRKKGNIVRDETYPASSHNVLTAQGFDRTVAANGVVTLDDPADDAVFLGGVPLTTGLVDTTNLPVGSYRLVCRVKSAGAYAAAAGIELVHRNAADNGDIEIVANWPIGSDGVYEGYTTVQVNESFVLRANSGATVTAVEVDLTVTRVF